MDVSQCGLLESYLIVIWLFPFSFSSLHNRSFRSQARQRRRFARSARDLLPSSRDSRKLPPLPRLAPKAPFMQAIHFPSSIFLGQYYCNQVLISCPPFNYVVIRRYNLLLPLLIVVFRGFGSLRCCSYGVPRRFQV